MPEYTCHNCNKKVVIHYKDPVICTECGNSRIFYKPKIAKPILFLAR
jgi:DNA-directed RNA polymerase subunit RPC12/RpoP